MQATIAHDSYDDQQEIPRAFNHNEGNAIISGCIPDYNSVSKPPMIISTSDITDAYDEIALLGFKILTRSPRQRIIKMLCQSDLHFDAQFYLLMLLVHSMHSTELQPCIAFVCYVRYLQRTL